MYCLQMFINLYLIQILFTAVNVTQTLVDAESAGEELTTQVVNSRRRKKRAVVPDPPLIVDENFDSPIVSVVTI